jgi:hypothetical protein
MKLFLVVACYYLDIESYSEDDLAIYTEKSHAEEHVIRAHHYLLMWKGSCCPAKHPNWKEIRPEYKNPYDVPRKDLYPDQDLGFLVREVPFYCHFDKFLEENNL